MITISFYSYKGGVGRSLTLTNLGVYLAQFGATVAMVDFDLEAPGLQYKIQPGSRVDVYGRGLAGLLADTSRGVDIAGLDWDVVQDVTSESIADGTNSAPLEQSQGRLLLIPAGDPVTPGYWDDVGDIDWHRLFSSGERPGVAVLAQLKQHLIEKFSPDVLLVDSRTGITPGGGVATTLLPDIVVVLTLNSAEHLDGSRLVISAVTASGSEDAQPPTVVPVLSRYTSARLTEPEVTRTPTGVRRVTRKVVQSEQAEQIPLEELHEALIEGLPVSGADRVGEPLVLHADLALQQTERLAFGPYATTGSSAPSQALLDDYLRLFRALVPKELFVQYLGGVRNRVRSILLDNPEDAVRTLESLAMFVGDEEVFIDLIKIYVLRRDTRGMLAAADRLFRVHERIVAHAAVTAALRNLITGSPVRMREIRDLSPEFVAAYWLQVGKDDWEWGAAVARYLADSGSMDRGLEVAKSALDGADEHAPALMIHHISKGQDNAERLAVRLALEYFDLGASSKSFLKAATQACVYQEDATLARRILAVESSDDLNPIHRIRLLNIAGERKQAGEALMDAVETSDRSGQEFGKLAELWRELVQNSSHLRIELRNRDPSLLHEIEEQPESEDVDFEVD
jgi:hypothetical protein